MNSLAGKPELLKQANRSLIRNVIRELGSATRAEITETTHISSTTVRSLLTEMMQNGEIESAGHDESSGGRKAERYRLEPERYHGAAFCLSDSGLHCLLVNMFGEITESSVLETAEEGFEQAILKHLDRLTQRHELSSIGLGVPGIADGGCFWKKDMQDGTLHKINLGGIIAVKYGIPAVMENDLNATAIGFSLRYAKEHPLEDPEKTNMVYLHFEKGCVSAGIIADGRIIRGFGSFAGELGLIPVHGGKPLDEYMGESMDSAQYIRTVSDVLSWICGILNPQYIVLSGSDFRKECIEPAVSSLKQSLPGHMLAQILYSEDVWRDYHEGMAHLTAGKMFDDVQVVKE